MTRPPNSNTLNRRESADSKNKNKESAADSLKTNILNKSAEFASKLQIANLSSNNKNIGNIRESAVNQLVNQLTGFSRRISILKLLERGYRHVATLDAWYGLFRIEGDCIILEGTDEGLIDVWCRDSFVIRGEVHG